MKLKRIELQGFKSFAKKSRLDFDMPVTGIVGPNGSGKSNVVEAFRFVLGEQSIKSLRGKSGKDLVFKGSKDLPKMSRASVEAAFDNKDKIFKLGSGESEINLDYDEIILKREVFSDGSNSYYINNTSVRLKDIVELLSSVNIGSSGHHIISQGQADRILSASAKDRRSMIEDALGLKAYQYKIKDSLKKLEKTEINMKEVASLRREISPHIKYLKKQVEKVEKGEELRRDLSKLYLRYFKEEESAIFAEDADLKNRSHEGGMELKEVEVKLKAFMGSHNSSFEIAKNEEIEKIQKEISGFDKIKEDLNRRLGRLEGAIEFENKSKSVGAESISISVSEINSFVTGSLGIVDAAMKADDLASVRDNISSIRSIISAFGDKYSKKKEKDEVISFKDLETAKNEVLGQLSEIEKEKARKAEELTALKRADDERRNSLLKDQEERFAMETRRNRLLNDKEVLEARMANHSARKAAFEEETKEAVALVGTEILGYKNHTEDTQNNFAGEDLKKQIERIKIRLEDIGTGGGADIMKEYREITERDTFLSNELGDLEKSIGNLKILISELRETLDREFKDGLEEINKRFEEFFMLMFGGGSAYLSNIVQNGKRNSKEENDDEEESNLLVDEEDSLEQGIEINVTLPQKKVKDLHMLSGGERSLTSIALVFALTQVNPPPFLVLDETDAALDEANSKRYGDMIEKLSKYSELIVVTHNRETMSRADVIYGVTIGSDGSSKLLSIKFDEAESYAK